MTFFDFSLELHQLVRNQIETRGAFPCIGFIDLEEYLSAFYDLDITFTPIEK